MPLTRTATTAKVLAAILVSLPALAHGQEEPSRLQLIDGDNVPLFQNTLESPSNVYVTGYWYGPPPSINDGPDGSYAIAFNRYKETDPDPNSGTADHLESVDPIGDNSIVNKLTVLWNGELADPIQGAFYPVLTDHPVPLTLYWAIGSSSSDGQVSIDGQCDLGSFSTPNQSGTAPITDTSGMPTFDAAEGRALVLQSDQLILKQPAPRGCSDTTITLDESPQGLDNDTRYLPRLNVISTTTAAFLVHWTKNESTISGLYSLDLSTADAEAKLRVQTGDTFSFEDNKTNYKIIAIGLPRSGDGLDSPQLRTISVNNAGQIVFRCQLEELPDRSNKLFAILSLSPEGDLSMIACDEQPFAGIDLCASRCGGGDASSDDQFHPSINSIGDVAFTAARSGVNTSNSQGIFVKRGRSGEEQVVIQEPGQLEIGGEYSDEQLKPVNFKNDLTLERAIQEIGKIGTNVIDSHHNFSALSSYGDVAVYCRLENDGTDNSNQQDEFIFIFDRTAEVVAWIQEGDGLRAHVWDETEGAYVVHELIGDATALAKFDCNPDDNYAGAKWDCSPPPCYTEYSFLRDGYAPVNPPFSFVRGSGGEDGRARAFGNYGQATAELPIPERTFVFAGDVFWHNKDNLRIKLRCKSGIFTLRLPAAASPPFCGNGLVENGEECDDGNSEDGDGCTGCTNDQPPCVGDFDDDGSIGLSDFSSFLVAFGTTCGDCPEDIDGDGTIGLGDFSAFLVKFGTDCP